MLTGWFVLVHKCTWNGVSSLIMKLHFLRSAVCNNTPLCKYDSLFVFRFLSNDSQIQLCPKAVQLSDILLVFVLSYLR
jgi:hypothetical protein